MTKKKRKPTKLKKPQTKPPKKMPWWKVTLIVIMSVVVVASIGVNAWWFYIYKFGADKVVSNTYEVGVQHAVNSETGEEIDRYFMEINYYKNSDKSGYEMFELKFNYMLDENNEAFYSQGLQYIGNNIDFNYKIDENSAKQTGGKSGLFAERYYDVMCSTQVKSGASRYNYASSDDYETTIISANPVGLNSSFKVVLGEQNFLMKFNNGDATEKNYYKTNVNFIRTEKGAVHYYVVFDATDYNSYYSYIDCDFLAMLLKKSIQSLPVGTSTAIAIEFGDLFNWYEYNSETGVYSETTMRYDDSLKVISDFKTYYSIKVNIHDEGAKNAKTDSIFKTMFGSPNFSLVETEDEQQFQSYFVGRTVIDVTMDNLELVVVEDNKCKVRLNEKFRAAYLAFKDDIVLNVTIVTAKK